MTAMSAGSSPGERPTFLAIDTATSRAVIAVGTVDRPPIGQATWHAGYRHGEELLARIDRLLVETGIGLEELDGIVVGTGPGAFTGLRVGLATAKGLAHGLGLPIVGVPTSTGLLSAARRDLTAQAAESADPPLALLLPAGPSDQVLVDIAGARLLAGGNVPQLPSGTRLVAVDLDGRAPPDAVAIGARAQAGLAEGLLRIGASRLSAGDADDLSALVPEYVSLPRGVTREVGEVAWSRDPR